MNSALRYSCTSHCPLINDRKWEAVMVYEKQENEISLKL